jgi:hypothetical protein
MTAGELRELSSAYDDLNAETSRSVLEFYQSRKGNALVKRGDISKLAVQAH